MKQLLLSLGILAALSPLAASAAPFYILDYEDQTHYASHWDNPDNRALLEAKIKLNQSVYKAGVLTEDEHATASNKAELQKYTEAVHCAQNGDHSCRVHAKR